jgi:hypothetical protein
MKEYVLPFLYEDLTLHGPHHCWFVYLALLILPLHFQGILSVYVKPYLELNMLTMLSFIIHQYFVFFLTNDWQLKEISEDIRPNALNTCMLKFHFSVINNDQKTPMLNYLWNVNKTCTFKTIQMKDTNVCYFEIEVSQKLFSQMHLSLTQCGKQFSFPIA